MAFRDKTFCASPNCENACGRKMTEEERKELDEINERTKQRMADAFDGKNSAPIFLTGVSYSYFCGDAGEIKSMD